MVLPEDSKPGWVNPQRESPACLIVGHRELDLFLIFNATESTSFPFPIASRDKSRFLAVDTFRLAFEDLSEPGTEPSLHDRARIIAGPRSSVILLARQ